MAMRIVGHGGHCCGIKHIYGFGHNGATAQKLREFNVAFDQYREHTGGPDEVDNFDYGNADRNLILEATLTNNQLAADNASWVRVLREKGFRRVSYFNNGNSGNNVNVFHYTPERNPEPQQGDPWLDNRPARRRAR